MRKQKSREVKPLSRYTMATRFYHAMEDKRILRQGQIDMKIEKYLSPVKNRIPTISDDEEIS